MTPHTLPKLVTKGRKRLGRGLGSGKGGHTVGRGQKGQKSRERVAVSFFGTKMKKSFLKRLPMLRGKGKLKASPKRTIIKVGELERFPPHTTVTQETVAAGGLLKQKNSLVKIVGGGTLTKSLNVALPVTESVRRLIEKKGGKVL